MNSKKWLLTNLQNPLNFKGRRGSKYGIEQGEEPALAMSQEILSSASQYLPSFRPSLYTRLSLCAAHLRAPVECLWATFQPFSKKIIWLFLTDTKKCYALRNWCTSREASSQRLLVQRNKCRGLRVSRISCTIMLRVCPTFFNFFYRWLFCPGFLWGICLIYTPSTYPHFSSLSP